MRASIKTLKNKNGELDIFVELFLDNKNRPRKKIGSTHPRHWDNENKEIFNTHPFYKLLFPTIKLYHSRIAQVNFGDYSFEAAKKILFTGDENHQEDFLQFYKKFISERKLLGQNIAMFELVYSELVKFSGDSIPFSSINYEWLQKFIIYKKGLGTGTAGVNTYLRTIKSVYREAQRRTSLGVPPGNPFDGLIKNVAPKPRPLITPEHLREIFNFTPLPSTTHHNQKIMLRNIAMFRFQLLIGGHDYADIASLKWENIQGGRLVFKRFKNRNKNYGGEEISNIIVPEAQAIINKYGTKNKDRIFGFIPEPGNYDKYRQYCRGIARSLERIAKSAGIPHVTLKSPRFIFRTMAGELLIHDILVAKIMGHKLEGITYRYQSSISKKVQDQAHLKIIEELFKK